jgi:hypothetical protein
MEMRDRSGFDLDGRGEDERNDPSGPTFEPGLSLVYTDENHGYGNAGVEDPPAQTPLDARPEPGSATPNLDDAAFRAVAGRNRFTDGGTGHVDNYTNPAETDSAFRLAFDCLSFRVTRMAGDTNGPSPAPGDLNGDVSLATGRGCAPFDYGHQKGSNAVATPGVTPTTAGSLQACASASSYRRARVRRASRGRRLRFDIAPRTRGRTFRVDVFTAATTRRVTPQRLVARFRERRASFTWNGRGQGGRRVGDGLYVVRVLTGRGRAVDVKRFALRRSRGRFTVERAYDRFSSCGVVRQFRATRPAFGGRTGRPLDLRYRLARNARVTVTVLQGRKVVRSFRAVSRRANRTYKQRITALRLPKGSLRFVLRVKAADKSGSITLYARRL